MEHYISKKAKAEGEAKDVLQKALSVVWKEDRGMFENLLPVMTYAALLWGPLNIVQTLLAAFGAHVLDISPAKLGKWLDEQAGTGPGQAPPVETVGTNLEKSFSSALQQFKAAQISNRHLTKEANIFSAITRLPGLAKILAGGLQKFITVVLGVFGLTSIEGLLKKGAELAREATGFEGVPAEVKKQIDKSTESKPLELPEKLEIMQPEETKNDIDSEIDRLQEKYNLK